MLGNYTDAKHNQQHYICIMMLIVSMLFVSAFANDARAESVYDNQKPMEDKELSSFIKLLPQFRAWAVSMEEEANPITVDGKPDFKYSESAAQWVQGRGWDPRRFFSIMGRAFAAVFLLAEGIGIESERPLDMPAVTQEELDLVSKYLAELLNAGSDSPPISQ